MVIVIQISSYFEVNIVFYEYWNALPPLFIDTILEFMYITFKLI